MAFDLIVWKWGNDGLRTDPLEIITAIGEDTAHPAIARFDMRLFLDAITAEFGDVNRDPDGPFLYDVSDVTGVPANWITFSINWSSVETVCPALLEIARGQQLAVYDPQKN